MAGRGDGGEQRRRTPKRADAGRGSEGRGRGERAGLTRERVIEGGLALAEREGLESVTVRRLASELGVAPNALYTYVADKTSLLDALFDAVLGRMDAPDVEAGEWTDVLAEVMRRSRRLLLAYPHLVTLFLTRPGGENAERLGELTLRALARGGIRGEAATDALRALLAYTLGSAALEVGRSRTRDAAFERGLKWLIAGMSREGDGAAPAHGSLR